MFSHIFFCF
jgi:hypothetical protein